MPQFSKLFFVLKKSIWMISNKNAILETSMIKKAFDHLQLIRATLIFKMQKAL